MFNPINKVFKLQNKSKKQHKNRFGHKYCDIAASQFYPVVPEGSVHLNELQPGEKARIVTLIGCSRFHNRLLEMGFLPGTEVQVIRYAPIGDPMEIDVLGTKLSIRKAEAAMIVVQKIEPLSK